jgi:predicted DNA repair protein MutK
MPTAKTSLRLLQQNTATVGRPLLIFAPKMIKLLPIVGTIAMLLVADDILTHSFALRGFIINQCRRSSC